MGFNEIRVPTSSSTALSAEMLTKTYNAANVIYSGELVMAIDPTTVDLATCTSTVKEATVLGVAMNDAILGGTVTVALFGAVNNAAYSIFTANEPLFLGIDGAITNTRPVGPTAKFLTQIGKALGNNVIFININPTMVI